MMLSALHYLVDSKLTRTNHFKYAQKSLMQKSGDIMADLFGEELHTSGTETEIELNFTVLKLRYSVKRERGEK